MRFFAVEGDMIPSSFRSSIIQPQAIYLFIDLQLQAQPGKNLLWDVKFKKACTKWVHQHPELKAQFSRKNILV
jgi:hypothetical protein